MPEFVFESAKKFHVRRKLRQKPDTALNTLEEYLRDPLLLREETPACLVREVNNFVRIDSCLLVYLAVEGQNAYAQPVYVLEGEGNNGPDTPVHDFTSLVDGVKH